MTLAAENQGRTAPGVYAGLFLTALSTLMYEILLTRVFSVTMWYHFAFTAVSVALFGMTLGAMIVYFRPRLFPDEQVRERLFQSAILFSVALPISFVVQLAIPFRPEWSVTSILIVALTYLVIAVPFVMSGIVVCLTLTRFTRDVSRLYAADLIGAALGTVLLIWLLNLLGDAPSAAIAIAGLAAAGAACYASALDGRQRVAVGGGVALLLMITATGNAYFVQHEQPALRIFWSKGVREDGIPLYERWNEFSRVRVRGDTDHLLQPFGWGDQPGISRG